MPETTRAEDREYQRRLAAQQEAARRAAEAFAAHKAQQQSWMSGGSGAPKAGGGSPFERAQGWQQALGMPQYPQFTQTKAGPTVAGGGWDLIRRGAEITGESSPWLMPVLQSRLPEGAAPATVPAARASWGGTAPQYGGGGYGSGGWGGSYPSTAQQALWWDPGLYNWRYGVSY